MKGRHWLLLTAFPLLACSKDAERDPYAPSASSPPPHATENNPAPLGNVSESEREQDVGEKPAPQAVETSFESLGRSASLEGKADLIQGADGVHVHLRLERARPGKARMAVEPSACSNRWSPGIRSPSGLEKRGATPAVLSGPPPGEIEIQENGQADYTTTLPNATLEPGAPNSLAGKALVVYQARALNTKLRTSEVPIACAMVPKHR